MKTNRENLCLNNTPEFNLLESIDMQITILEETILALKKKKSNIFYLINNEKDWSEIFEEMNKD